MKLRRGPILLAFVSALQLECDDAVGGIYDPAEERTRHFIFDGSRDAGSAY
jgi:hypothetical protein